MKIRRTYQLAQLELLSRPYDLFIASSGYEARSTHIAKLKPLVYTSAVFGFVENKGNEVRINNDAFYERNNYSYQELSISDNITIAQYLADYISSSDKPEIFILVDYSSMTRCWYSSIIHFLRTHEGEGKRISITFAYSRATFTLPPDNENQTYFFEPIPGFSTLSIPNNPTALIVGLGYEKRRAFGLKEFFDAEETYAFFTDEDSASEFYPVILDKNKELLSQIEDNYKFEYPINDLLYTKKLLSDISSSLNKDYRVLITPCGPKPFTLISLLVAIEHRNIDVWRISGEKGFSNSNRVASGEILSITVECE